MLKTCLKCQHATEAGDDPLAECPKCGAIYSRVEATQTRPRRASRTGVFVTVAILITLVTTAALFLTLPNRGPAAQRLEQARAQKQEERAKRVVSFKAARNDLLKSALAQRAAGDHAAVVAGITPWKDVADQTLLDMLAAGEAALADEARRQTEFEKSERRRIEQQAQAAEDRIASRIGPRPVPSAWDSSYDAVDRYLDRIAHDPDSVDYEGCTSPRETESGWVVRCEYRARNGFGALVKQNTIFVIKHAEVIAHQAL